MFTPKESVKDNPFLVSGYISPKYFCDREKEVAIIQNAADNRRNLTLFSPRRYGKTGLLYHAFYYLNKKGYKTIYIDLYDTENQSQFIQEFSNAIIKNLETKKDAIIKKAMELFGSIRPQFSFNQLTGIPEMQLNLQTESEKQATLAQIFQYLNQQKGKLLIAIDEFQQIANYPEKNTEALLRKQIQQQVNTRFIFSGSQKHMLLPIFTDHTRPFYQSTEFLQLEKLDHQKYKKFITTHFEKNGMKIEAEAVDYILDWTKIHTFYTQYVCNKLFSKRQEKIRIQEVKVTLIEIFAEREVVFHTIMNLLAKNQANLLKAIAKEGEVTEPTGSAFIRKHQLSTGATISKALKVLLDKELVYETIRDEKPVYQLNDVFMLRWLEMK